MPVGQVDLEGLDVQPSVLTDVKKTVIYVIIFLLIMIPDSSFIKGKSGMHAKPEEPVPVTENMVKFLHPPYKLAFKHREVVCWRAGNKFEHRFLQFLAEFYIAKQDLGLVPSTDIPYDPV
jgi:hypothetical protein